MTCWLGVRLGVKDTLPLIAYIADVAIQVLHDVGMSPSQARINPLPLMAMMSYTRNGLFTNRENWEKKKDGRKEKENTGLADNKKRWRKEGEGEKKTKDG
jgi:hypothetical protein